MPEKLAIFKSLQHPTRLEILEFLGDNPQDIPYTDLLGFCEGSTGKLNYHLRALDDMVMKDKNGYNISEKGKRVLAWLKSYEFPQEIADEFERPDVFFNKLFPARSLHHKFWLEILCIAALIAIPLGFVAYITQYFIIPFGLWFAGILIAGLLTKLYVDNIWYRITDTEVEVYKGIITKTHKIVPFRTMTNVELKQGIFDRIFGLSTVDIHTAGSAIPSAGTEAIIGMIEGEEIKDTILESIRLLNPILFQNKPRESKLTKGLRELRDELQQLNGEISK